MNSSMWLRYTGTDAMGNQYERSGMGSYGQGFWRGAMIGGSTAALGFGAGSLGSSLGVFASGAWPGAIYGCVTGGLIGAYSGGMSAATLGTSISNGMLSGALSGAISGAIMGGIEGYRQSGEQWSVAKSYKDYSISESPIGDGPPLFPTNEDMQENISNVSGHTEGRDNTTTSMYDNYNSAEKLNGGIIRTTLRDNNGQLSYYDSKDGVKIGGASVDGFTDRHISFWGRRSSEVYFSRFSSSQSAGFYDTMNHEFMHAYHHYINFSSTELQVTKWSPQYNRNHYLTPFYQDFKVVQPPVQPYFYFH